MSSSPELDRYQLPKMLNNLHFHDRIQQNINVGKMLTGLSVISSESER
jgi:hypothetical protein